MKPDDIAAKLFVKCLDKVKHSTLVNSGRYHWMDHCFDRVWIQGIIVEEPFSSMGGCTFIHLDDGSGVVQVDISLVLRNVPEGAKLELTKGVYAMVIGTLKDLNKTEQKKLYVHAHQLINNNENKNQETFWNLEVVNLWSHIWKKNYMIDLAE